MKLLKVLILASVVLVATVCAFAPVEAIAYTINSAKVCAVEMVECPYCGSAVCRFTGETVFRSCHTFWVYKCGACGENFLVKQF